MKDKIGVWSFTIGLILAILISIFTANNVPQWAVFVLAVIGIIVGLINISDKEVNTFLIAGISFLISFQALGAVIKEMAFGWMAVSTFFFLMAVFVAPATAIVAVKAIFNIARD